MPPRRVLALIAALTLATVSGLAAAQHQGAQHQGSQHRGHAPAPHAPASSAEDMREPVAFPAELRAHTLANMRDHLLALQEIQEFLARGEFDRAASTAEERLGMSSLRRHGAHEVAKFMPPGMQEAGGGMHRAASRFAIEAQNGSITGELKPALSALAAVTAQCVGCHAAYRFK